jgi:hypothetical protein
MVQAASKDIAAISCIVSFISPAFCTTRTSFGPGADQHNAFVFGGLPGGRNSGASTPVAQVGEWMPHWQLAAGSEGV